MKGTEACIARCRPVNRELSCVQFDGSPESALLLASLLADGSAHPFDRCKGTFSIALEPRSPKPGEVGFRAELTGWIPAGMNATAPFRLRQGDWLVQLEPGDRGSWKAVPAEEFPMLYVSLGDGS